MLFNHSTTSIISAWRQLHKNAASNIEQVLETAPYKVAAHSQMFSSIIIWYL